MDNTLTALYALQQVDSQLEEIAELKGDLPGLVASLQSQTEEMTAKLKELSDLARQLKAARDQADMEMIALTEKIEKYKNQQLQVKSNKQYDALAKEIDSSETTIGTLGKDMETSEGKMQVAKSDTEELKKRFEEMTAELTEKEAELREVNKEHEKEETKLRDERARILASIPEDELERYERIRKAKGGKAIVPVKRNACGGCFNRIPPQKIIELHNTSNLYMCENCGRIIVSDEVVTRSAALL